jgi:membrane-bound metal-dependent hydrolase YbcI (DUF457 family)
MNTHAHAVLTWSVARRCGAAKRAATAAAVGSVLPDVPYTAKALMLVAQRRTALTKDLLASELDFDGEPDWRLDLVLHSLLVPGAVAVLRRRGPRRRSGLGAWFIAGWLGHNAVDLLTHASDARPHLWPLSRRRWRSPVSYWDRDRHALAFLVVEQLAVVAALRAGRRPGG